MKKLFYTGIFGLILFEIANVYFIMPMPGSQQMNSIDIAYFLYSWRWLFRILFGIMILAGFKNSFSKKKIISIILLLLCTAIIYATNFMMAADSMFYQPKNFIKEDITTNKVPLDKLIIGVTNNGEAAAYPIQFMGYHHQVRDTVGGMPVMVTYCTVCRTGRVFQPMVNGKEESFRLVGMDHFNAMFEDNTTKSWWRQETGQAIAGKLKGQELPEVPAAQMTLAKWISLYRNTRIMQPDSNFKVEYDSMQTYEKGKLTGTLTRRDTASWQDKSWVIGLLMNNESKAYDWNLLQKEKIIYDTLAGTPIVIILSTDGYSFSAFERVSAEQTFILQDDTIVFGDNKYDFYGRPLNATSMPLQRIKAYQEYWHSWRTFHPDTKKY